MSVLSRRDERDADLICTLMFSSSSLSTSALVGLVSAGLFVGVVSADCVRITAGIVPTTAATTAWAATAAVAVSSAFIEDDEDETTPDDDDVRLLGERLLLLLL